MVKKLLFGFAFFALLITQNIVHAQNQPKRPARPFPWFAEGGRKLTPEEQKAQEDLAAAMVEACKDHPSHADPLPKPKESPQPEDKSVPPPPQRTWKHICRYLLQGLGM
jgi:hypothetical protein